MFNTDKKLDSCPQKGTILEFDENKKGGFWTSKEAANYLRTTPKQIRNWAYQGKLAYYKLLGRKLLFRKIDLDALLEKKGGN